jgi:glycerophosphoryl diester phosphodiesterase
MTTHPVQISVHDHQRVNGELGPRQGYEDALTSQADYVEFDIRRTADAELVTFHDTRTGQGRLVSQLGYAQLCDLVGREVPKIADVLAVIKGRARAHLDLKETGDEDQLVRLAPISSAQASSSLPPPRMPRSPPSGAGSLPQKRSRSH